jgi:hypothetical protein
MDIDDLGARESSAVTYTWSFVNNISGLVVWLVLGGVFVLFRENRSRKALLVLVPLLVVNVLWLGIKKAIGMPSSTAAQFDVMFNAFTVGVTIVWLVSHKFAGLNRFVIFLLALIVLDLSYVLNIFSFSGFAFDDETVMLTAFFCVAATTTLFGFVLTGWRCRIRYTALRFMLWQAVWCIAVCVMATFIYVVIAFVIMGQSTSLDASFFVQILLVGPIFSGILYVLLLPFMILAFKNSLFRERFYGCFRLKGMGECCKIATVGDSISTENGKDLI